MDSTKTDFTVFFNGNSLGTQTNNNPLANFDINLLGSRFLNSLDGSIEYFKAYKNGVLVRNLPLETNATDTTGNSTPVATNITFSTIAGYSPTTPLTHARIGYQSLLTSTNITASAAVSGFRLIIV